MMEIIATNETTSIKQHTATIYKHSGPRNYKNFLRSMEERTKKKNQFLNLLNLFKKKALQTSLYKSRILEPYKNIKKAPRKPRGAAPTRGEPLVRSTSLFDPSMMSHAAEAGACSGLFLPFSFSLFPSPSPPMGVGVAVRDGGGVPSPPMRGGVAVRTRGGVPSPPMGGGGAVRARGGAASPPMGAGVAVRARGGAPGLFLSFSFALFPSLPMGVEAPCCSPPPPPPLPGRTIVGATCCPLPPSRPIIVRRRALA